MRAVIFEEHGGIDKLKYLENFPKPTAGPHDVIVRVRACALNHLDIWVRQGLKGVQISMPHILGCDIAGEVVEVGTEVKDVPLQQPVLIAPGISCGSCAYCDEGWDSLCDQYKIIGFQVNGGYAEFVSVPAANLIPVDNQFSFEEWAACPLVFLTAWHMLVTRAELKPGEYALIHAAGSGVGSAAIQIAKYLGAQVITTVGSDEKADRARSLGADYVINYKKQKFPDEVKKITQNAGVNVVLEHIGPETFQGSLLSLSKKGRLVTCGVTSGPSSEIDLRYVFARQLSIIGCYMGGRLELNQVIDRIRKGAAKPVVDIVFPLKEATKAHKRMLDRQNFGKIVLKID